MVHTISIIGKLRGPSGVSGIFTRAAPSQAS
jgi:hypothetical protein